MIVPVKMARSIFGCLLQWAYPVFSGTATYCFYLETLTVQPSAALIQWIAPQDGVLACDHRLAWPG